MSISNNVRHDGEKTARTVVILTTFSKRLPIITPHHASGWLATKEPLNADEIVSNARHAVRRRMGRSFLALGIGGTEFERLRRPIP